MGLTVLKRCMGMVLVATLLFSGEMLQAGEKVTAKKPGAKETCPVCGMFVSLYPDWTAWASGQDGSVRFFDGAKDLFKFIQAPEKWAAPKGWGKTVQAVVTEYYTLSQVDATHAFFVIGSDVLGPMGHELVPLQSRADAETFLKDHKGQRILTFEEVTGAVINALDQGRFK